MVNSQGRLKVDSAELGPSCDPMGANESTRQAGSNDTIPDPRLRTGYRPYYLYMVEHNGPLGTIINGTVYGSPIKQSLLP